MAKGKIIRQWSSNGNEYRWRRVWNSVDTYVCLEQCNNNLNNKITNYKGEEFVEKKTYILGCVPVWKKVWKEEMEGDFLMKSLYDGNIYSKLANILFEKYNMPADSRVKFAV